MSFRITVALLAGALFCACTIESVTFTPLADDGPDPDASTDCGDGARQDPEVCDGADLAGADCTTAGAFTGGTLACGADCALDTSRCGTAPTVPVLRKPPNNAHVGVITASNTLRPTFYWEPSSALEGEITYELEYTTDATFATGVTTVSTTETSHRPAAGLTVSMTAPVEARYHWRVRACSADCSEPSSAWSMNAGPSPHDFNGDGFADVIFGAPESDPYGATSSGTAHLVRGLGAAAFELDHSITGASAGDFLGWSATLAGDVNADGFADVVIGAPGAGANSAGRAYVFLGGPSGTFNFGIELNGVADGDDFGISVGGAGDVNGDGFADIVVC